MSKTWKDRKDLGHYGRERLKRDSRKQRKAERKAAKNAAAVEREDRGFDVMHTIDASWGED